jgi:H+/Cl- antiporter ClcA
MTNALVVNLLCWYLCGLFGTILCNTFDLIYKNILFSRRDILPILLYALGGIIILMFAIYYYFNCRKFWLKNRLNRN